MSRRPIAAIATFLVLTAMLIAGSGCNGPATAVFKHAQGTPERFSDSLSDRTADDAPYEMSLDGPVGLDIDLFNGDVNVVVNPEAEKTTLTFTRGASHGYKRKDDAIEALGEVDYTFDIVPGELGRVLEIRATTESPEPHYLRVDLEIEVPEVENVRIRSGVGSVEVLNATGTVDIEVRRGNLRYFTMIPVRRSVRMITGRGNIDLRVRGESSGAVLAESLRGEVRHRVTRGRWLVKPGTSFNRMHASLNGGGNPIELRTYEGDVRFASVEDPLDVGAMILD